LPAYNNRHDVICSCSPYSVRGKVLAELFLLSLPASTGKHTPHVIAV